MGYIRHHAIVVSCSSYKHGYEDDEANRQHLEAIRKRIADLVVEDAFKPLSLPVSELLSIPINGDYCFFIGPDGSKEGWGGSAAGDELRAKAIEIMRQERKTGNAYFNWAEVQYNDDSGETLIVSSSDGDRE